MTEESIKPLRSVARKLAGLWPLLTEEEQARVEAAMEVKHYKKNHLVYAEGESPDHLLAVLSGKVKIFRDGVGGRSQIMRLLGPGQYLGYRAHMAHEPYVTAAAAFEEADVAHVPMSLISEIITENNRVARFFISELAKDLGISDRRMVSLTQKHVRGRLAESLLYLRDIYGIHSRDGRLMVQITREDLAAFSNMTTANAIRTLMDFAKEGVLQVQGKDILLTDLKLLEEISLQG
jgi:FNR family transcriptional regulator